MKNFLRETDSTLILLSVVLSLIGVLIIASAVFTWEGHGLKYVAMQLGAVLAGLFAMWLIYVLGHENLADYWKWIYGIMVVLLVAVLIFGTGEAETGTSRWLRIGSFGFQPAEIAKICFIITLAKHLELIKDDINYIKNAAILLAHALIPVMLIALQPDAGTAIAFIFIFFVMMFISGIDWRYIAWSVGTFIAASPFIYFFFLQDYQKERIIEFFKPGTAPSGASYQVLQSKLAIGSGNIFGNKLFSGLQTQGGLLPAKHTDFIFAVIGEELGFIGCIVVIALFFGIIWRCLVLARRCGDNNRLGRLICVGVASYLAFHGMENILMTVGLAPVTGIPLPFLSYGGTSLLASMVAVGFAASSGNR